MEEDETLQETEDFVVVGSINDTASTNLYLPSMSEKMFWKSWCIVLIVGIIAFNFGVLFAHSKPLAYATEPSFPTQSPTISPTCMTPEPSVPPTLTPTLTPTKHRPQCILVAGPESSGTHLIFNIVSFALGLTDGDDFTYHHGVVKEELGDINFKGVGSSTWHRSLPHGGGAHTKITELDPKLSPFQYKCCKRIFIDPFRMRDYVGDRCDFKVIFVVRDTTVIKRSQVYVQHTLNHDTATQATNRALEIVNQTLMDSSLDSHLISYEAMLALPIYTLNLLADFIGVPRSIINNIEISGGNEKYCDGKTLDEDLQKKVRGDMNRFRAEQKKAKVTDANSPKISTPKKPQIPITPHGNG